MLNTPEEHARARGARVCGRARAGAGKRNRPAPERPARGLRHAPSSGHEALRNRRRARAGGRHGEAPAPCGRPPAPPGADPGQRHRGRAGMSTRASVLASGAIELYFYDELTRPGTRGGREPRAVVRTLPHGARGAGRHSRRAGAASRTSGARVGRLVRVHVAARRVAGERACAGRQQGAVCAQVSSATRYVSYVADGRVAGARDPQRRRSRIRSRAVAPLRPVTGTGRRSPVGASPHGYRGLHSTERGTLRAIEAGRARAWRRRIRSWEAADWAYERELATSLLNDTRMYRLAAEDRGLVARGRHARPGARVASDVADR